MTSAARRTNKRRARGFTILEMVMVLSIFILMIGGGIAALYFNRDQARLNDAVGEVEILAKRARTLATLQQRPYAIEFTPLGAQLMPYSEAVLDPRERERMLAEQAEMIEAGLDLGTPVSRDGWQVDEDMLLLVRRWTTGRWEEIKSADRHVWRFDPKGISEPVGVRIELQSGSWIAVLFHPLTAGITETESEIL